MSSKTEAPASEELSPAADLPDLPPLPPPTIFDLCATDSDASETGKWFDDLYAPDSGVSVKLRRFTSKKSISFRQRLLLKYKRYADRKGDFPQEIDERMLIEQMAECIIVDWKGIRGNDGAELPYSKERALELCRMLDFRFPLVALATQMDNFRAEEKKETEGN